MLKKLFVIYLKFKLNWALCIFPYVLNLAILVTNPESQVREDFCPSPPMHVTLGKNAESEGDPRCSAELGTGDIGASLVGRRAQTEDSVSTRTSVRMGLQT